MKTTFFKKRLIPFTVPQVEHDSLFTIGKCLLKGDIYNGPDIYDFEKEFARYIGVRYAISFASGRYALYLIYKFFNCKDKYVLVPAYTCSPAIDAVRWADAKPFFVDVDLMTYNPIFNEALRLNNIGAICLSYLYGLVGDIGEILIYAKRKKIPVIEDAAIALGGSFEGKKVGSLGDAAIFSLQSSKILTGWKGGVITTDREDLYNFLCKERKKQSNPFFLKLLLNLFVTYMRVLCASPVVYGKTIYPIKRIAFSKNFGRALRHIVDQNPTEAIAPDTCENLPYYEQVKFTNIQAAIARSSFKRIDYILKKRRQLAKMLAEELKDNDKIKIPEEKEKIKHAYGRYPIRITGLSKFELEKYFLEHGIEIALNYPYLCPDASFMRTHSLDKKSFKNSILASRETFLLPFHTFMANEDVYRIAEAVKDVVRIRLN